MFGDIDSISEPQMCEKVTLQVALGVVGNILSTLVFILYNCYIY